MNNMKFIARYLAIGAILTGVSSQVNSQDCPVDVECPTGGTLTSTSVSDQWGEDFIPDAGSENLAVDQFDKSFYAALHGLPESEISLLGVEVKLTATVTEMHWELSNISTKCRFDWTWPVEIEIQANAAVGTPVIASPPINQSDHVDLNPGDTYIWDLHTDGGGVQSTSECYGTVAGLAPWIGNGLINWDVSLLAFPAQTGCSNADQSRFVKGIVTVEVTYRYCFGSIPPPEGCVCDSPSPNYRRPGSLLLFPEYDTRQGEYTVITVTNVDCINGSDENVDIEFVFVDKDGCEEFNTTETLTPCDTFTFLANSVIPSDDQGYVYVFAKKYLGGGSTNGDPISWNYLVGNEMMISGFDFFDYSMNPVSFKSSRADGELTERDFDGYRDLDGVEYEAAPNIITIPRYFGQDGANQEYVFNSQLILIGLTGGQQFNTTACILYYNDNEEVFSTSWEFRCWDKPYLLDINFGFANDWLQNNTDHDPDEIFGADNREAGWICIEGCEASSTQESIMNPAIYAVLVEHVSTLGIADLPFECGTRTNGALVPRGVFGDPDSDTDGDGDVDDDDSEDGDNQ